MRGSRTHRPYRPAPVNAANDAERQGAAQRAGPLAPRAGDEAGDTEFQLLTGAAPRSPLGDPGRVQSEPRSLDLPATDGAQVRPSSVCIFPAGPWKC